mmetsp:Transcript_11398/g.13227  ORF Transcript_11398/g.13227 Transcript_11398/m.13227 type:complete len:208 (-) Transcript_11398:234-857(-)
MFLVNSISSRKNCEIASRTATLPPPTRHHLAHQIETTLSPTDKKLVNTLNETISSTKVTLEKMIDSELFLDTRIRKYRELLDESSVRLSSKHLTEGYDIENEAETKRQFLQQETNETKLNDVVQIQKNIIMEIEVLRRKVVNLEKKRDDLLMKREECEEFLVASATLDLERLGNDDDDDDDERSTQEVEMGVLNRQKYADDSSVEML